MTTAERIETILKERLHPAHLELRDESDRHKGHPGAASGGGHFNIFIVSAAFEGRSVLELHWMRCPKCGMELAEVTFRGVRIDRCTSCAGVWLDAGELETLSGAEPEGLLARLAGLFGQ